MKKLSGLFFALLLVAPIFAQTREDILVHIPPVMAARPDHAMFFKENFDAETLAASYALTDNINEADYVLRLEVRQNMVLYEDGFEEPAPPDEPQFLLQVTLIQREGDVEMVAFGFPFTEVEEMYEFNLFLLYQAMANVPLTRLGDLEIQDDLWRNKWFYIRLSLDLPFTVHALRDVREVWLTNADGSQNRNERPLPLHHVVDYNAGVTLGFELQYLHWMSSELALLVRFGDPLSNAFIPGLGVQVKFPIKPERHFMLEPYLMGQVQLNTVQGVHIPPGSVGGGMQFGVRGGPMGAFFVDANFMYTLGNIRTPSPYAARGFDYPERIPWNRWVISFGIGYKIGFVDRPPYIPRRERENPNGEY
ncbi:MAG: hypothetical protein FWG77_02520 [Treponema sp.]|nr:hypothetical protein [Treponema sp.]